MIGWPRAMRTMSNDPVASPTRTPITSRPSGDTEFAVNWTPRCTSESRWPLAVIIVATVMVGAGMLIATIARLFDLLYTGGAYG